MLRIEIALPRWIAIERFWIRKDVDLGSPKCRESLLPRDFMKERVWIPKTLIVSMAMRTKIWKLSKSAYFTLLRSSALAAIPPAEWTARLLWDWAKVSGQFNVPHQRFSRWSGSNCMWRISKKCSSDFPFTTHRQHIASSSFVLASSNSSARIEKWTLSQA